MFGKLSPYELGHLSEIYLTRLESMVEGQLQSMTTGQKLDERDVKIAFVDTMRAITMEIAKLEIATRESALSAKMSGMFAGHLIAA